MHIAKALGAVQPSASMAVSDAAKALKAAGEDVIDLGLGEPDFDTPAPIVEAAYRAAKEGQTRYTPTGGSAALKQAAVRKFERENGLRFEPNEIIVSNGAKQVIFDALMATLEQGDEVILAAPYFGSYADIVRILGGVPVVVACPAEAGFRLQPVDLEAAISPRTRWLILNSPSNPSGAVYTREQYVALGAVLERHPGVNILSDEIYEHITFTETGFVSFGVACPDLRERTLIANGVSKAYAMTGWRIGYGAGPAALIKAMTTVQSQATSGASSISQAGAVAALDGPQDSVAEFCTAFRRRRDLVVTRIATIPGLNLQPPEGAFYAYIDCSGWIGRTTPDGVRLTSDADIASFLLDHAKVAVVPGAAYGLSPFFRISTATADAILDTALSRIADAGNALTGASR